MSWIDKEIKKRTTAAEHSRLPAASPAPTEASVMAALWQKFEAANNALPPELKLPADHDVPAIVAMEVPKFLIWFRAANGGGLGFTGDAIRYVWPERNPTSSYNFWVRWTPDRGFRLARRVVSPITGPKVVDRSFSDKRAAYIIKCLVIGRRVKPRAVRRKRLWIF